MAWGCGCSSNRTPREKTHFLLSFRALLDAGCGVDMRDHERRPALHYAVKHGHIDIVRLLLEQGAEVSSRDWWVP